MTVRTRFAPSPTGFLHIGGVRTALYCWLYAKRFGGQFLLRIEDTDLERSERRFTDDILESMRWLGLTPDEEPIYQSKRLGVYAERAQELIQSGHAYPCYCTAEEIEEGRKRLEAAGKKPMYDRKCRELAPEAVAARAGQPFVIRAKLPLDGHVQFTDLIRGDIRFENADLDDFVLIRSIGAPTYNLSVVVDDVESRMTHIIRGDDHINNTPKQMHLYQFFDYKVPLFAHLPMILGPDKKKLSKRHGAVSANVYRADGYLPEALLNFLVRLGWSHGDQEVFSIQEMIDFFDFDHVQKSSGVFNTEKLLWVNGEHIRKATSQRLAEIVAHDYAANFSAPECMARVKSSIGTKLVALIQPKVKLMKELAEQLVPLCTPGTVEVDVTGLKWNKNAELKAPTQAAVKEVLDVLGKKMEGAPKPKRTGADAAWGDSPSLGDVGVVHEEIDRVMREVGEKHGVKLGDLAQPMRLVVTGRMVSAGLFELIPLLPWDLVQARLLKVSSL